MNAFEDKTNRMTAFTVEHKNLLPFWKERVTDAVWTVTRYGTGELSTISGLRVAKHWPARGTLRFTRDMDGKRFKLYATKKSFKCVEV